MVQSLFGPNGKLRPKEGAPVIFAQAMLDDFFILYAFCGSTEQAERRARITERAVRGFLETLGF